MGTCRAEARGGSWNRRAEPARIDIFFCFVSEARHQMRKGVGSTELQLSKRGLLFSNPS